MENYFQETLHQLKEKNKQNKHPDVWEGEKHWRPYIPENSDCLWKEMKSS